jgi:hypothetical protein
MLSREDVNKYYGIINELVDDYIDKWNIRPSSLKRYLKKGSDRYNKFLLRNNLSEVKGIQRVLDDVLEDRYYMEKDGVIKFESFVNESSKYSSIEDCIYNGIEKVTINFEKILADYYDTNLGDIDIIDSDKHIFNIKDWKKENIKILIYSKDDIDLIKENIVEYIYDYSLERPLDIFNDKDFQIKSVNPIKISDITDKDKFIENINKSIDLNNLIKIISDTFSFKYKGELKNYYIWER